MCFYHDYDWTAEVSDKEDVAAGPKVFCYECRVKIPEGHPATYFYQRERECCGECDVHYDDRDDEPCAVEGDEHAFGETFECHVCEACMKVRAAIRAVEEADGCKGSETQPAFGELPEVFSGRNNYDHVDEYAAEVLRRHPELTNHLKALGYEPKEVAGDATTPV